MLPPGVASWTDTSNNEAYLANRIAYTSNAGTMFAKAIVDKNPVAEQTLYVPKPLGPTGQRQQSSAGHYLYFMNGSPNFDPSVQLAEYLLSDTVQKEMWRISQGYVANASLTDAATGRLMWTGKASTRQADNLEWQLDSLTKAVVSGVQQAGFF